MQPKLSPLQPFTEGPLSPDLASAGQGLAFHVGKWRERRLDGGRIPGV